MLYFTTPYGQNPQQPIKIIIKTNKFEFIQIFKMISKMKNFLWQKWKYPQRIFLALSSYINLYRQSLLRRQREQCSFLDKLFCLLLYCSLLFVVQWKEKKKKKRNCNDFILLFKKTWTLLLQPAGQLKSNFLSLDLGWNQIF